MLSGDFPESFEQPLSRGLISEKRDALFGSDGYEIDAATEIVVGGKAEAFFEEDHARKASMQTGDCEEGLAGLKPGLYNYNIKSGQAKAWPLQLQHQEWPG